MSDFSLFVFVLLLFPLISAKRKPGIIGISEYRKLILMAIYYSSYSTVGIPENQNLEN